MDIHIATTRQLVSIHRLNMLISMAWTYWIEVTNSGWAKVYNQLEAACILYQCYPYLRATTHEWYTPEHLEFWVMNPLAELFVQKFGHPEHSSKNKTIISKNNLDLIQFIRPDEYMSVENSSGNSNRLYDLHRQSRFFPNYNKSCDSIE